MSKKKRLILERVASGELTPDEGLALLTQQPVAEDVDPEPARVLPVVIKADLGAVTVVGDPTVQDAVAVGAHVLRRTPKAIRIEGAHDGSVLSDGRLLPRRGRRHALRVRLRPDLPLKVRLGAGSVHVEGMDSSVDIEVELGTATLERLTGAFDVRVASGSVSVATLLTAGQSSVECELGTVSVRLDPASSATITATTEAGRVVLPRLQNRPAIVFGTKAEAAVGDGAAALGIKVGAGSVTVAVDR